MKISLTAFGIAKDILQSKHLELDIAEGTSILTLKKQLYDSYPEFLKLKSLSFAVGENYQDDSFVLSNADEVLIIPPVSGG